MNDGLSLKGTNQWALVSFTLIGFVIGYFANGILEGSSAAPAAAPRAQVAAQPSAPTPRVPAVAPSENPPDADDDFALGSKDAPVTIIEAVDYQCPFCKRFVDQTFPQIKKEYIDTGKVRFVFRDFPLSFHQQAQKASEATECAEDQGEFLAFHDLVFANQQQLDLPSLKRFAADLGLNTEEFDSCLDSGKYEEEVKKDFADLSAGGNTGTPGFFINGKKLSGAQPFSAFQAVIDAELSN